MPRCRWLAIKIELPRLVWLILCFAVIVGVAYLLKCIFGSWLGVERQFEWLGYHWWFPLQLFVLWLAHARLLMKDYGVERLFWEERRATQFFSLFGTGLLVGASLFTWFLLDKPTLFLDTTEFWPYWISLYWKAPVESDLQHCGRFVLCGMAAYLLLLIGTKLVNCLRQKDRERRWRFASSRRWFLPGLAGYVCAVLFSMLLHVLDFSETARAYAPWVSAGLSALGVLVLIGFRRRLVVEPQIVNAGHLRPSATCFWIWLAAFVASAAVVATLLARVEAERPINVTLQEWPGLKELKDRQPVTTAARKSVEEAGEAAHIGYLPARSRDVELRAVGVYLSIAVAVLIVRLLLLMAVLRGIERRWALNPAFLLCLLVVLSDLLLCYFVVDVRAQVSLVLAIGVVLAILNSGLFWWRDRYRFPGLESYYATPQPLASYSALPMPAAMLLSDRAVLKLHLKNLDKKKKLVVVVTSGGGIRSVVWTAHMLEKFDRAFGREWREQVRLITGASGGMVGAALWRGSFASPQVQRQKGRTVGFGPLADIAGTASLRPVVQTMLVRDMSLGLLYPPSAQCADRGRELEAQWELAAAEYYADANNPFRRTFDDLQGGERAGTHPSLVFCPVAVEDNRRFLISNLDLEHFAAPGTPSYSRSAYQLFKLFPSALGTLTLGTAARMNATFPIVSPLVPLPTDPPRRLMDAGLYDNYGVEFASNWLLRHRKTLMQESAGVVLVELRAFPLALPGAAAHADDYDMRSVLNLGEAAAILTGPLGALFRGRANITYHRNNAMLAGVADALPGMFDRVVFELDEEASISWYLSEEERKAIARFSNTAGIRAGIRELKKLL